MPQDGDKNKIISIKTLPNSRCVVLKPKYP